MEGDFLLKSGLKTNTYVDCRRAFLNSMSMSVLVPAFIEELKLDENTVLCGIPTSGLILTGAILHRAAVHRDIRACYLRTETKDHGTAKNFEGEMRKDDEIVILDDVLTSGNTVIRAINDLRIRNLNVKKVLVLLDRQEIDFQEQARRYNVEYVSLITLKELRNESLLATG